MEDVKIVVLCPTRGNRPKMLENMKRMMEAQTLQPIGMVVFDDAPVDPEVKDITYRYREGLKRCFELYPTADLVAFIEDDDWYSRFYLQLTASAWLAAGKPQLIGQGETYYYHLQLKAYHKMDHPKRASAYTTAMSRSGYEGMKWPADDYSFVDIEMWKQLCGRTYKFGVGKGRLSAIGIKGHNEGDLFGGSGHNGMNKRFNQKDSNYAWLKSVLDDDQESIEFYTSLCD